MMTEAATATRRRWFVTLGLAAIALAATRITLPFVDADVARHAEAANGAFTIGALGIQALLATALLVDLYCLIRPTLRPLRGGPIGQTRATERWAIGLALVVALVQARMIFVRLLSWSYSWGELLLDPSLRAEIVIIATLVGGFAGLVLAARGIDRYGLGNGVAVLVAATIVPTTIDSFYRGWLRVASEQDTPLALLFQAGLVTTVVLVTRWMLGRGPQTVYFATSPPRAPRRPTAGILPLLIATSLLSQLAGEARGGSRLPAVDSQVLLVVTLVIGIALSLAMHRRAAYEPMLYRRAIFESMLGLVALVGLATLLARLGSTLAVTQIVLATAVALDLHTEARARLHQGELVAFWRWPSVATLDATVRRLHAAGITVHARGAYTRSLFYGLMPAYPIDLLVAPADVERATQLLSTPEGS